MNGVLPRVGGEGKGSSRSHLAISALSRLSLCRLALPPSPPSSLPEHVAVWLEAEITRTANRKHGAIVSRGTQLMPFAMLAQLGPPGRECVCWKCVVRSGRSVTRSLMGALLECFSFSSTTPRS